MSRRAFKRKIEKGSDIIDWIVLRKLRRSLKKHEIDYTEKNGHILSLRQKDVEFLHNQVLNEVMTQLQLLNGDYKKLARLYSNRQ